MTSETVLGAFLFVVGDRDGVVSVGDILFLIAGMGITWALLTRRRGAAT